MAWFGEGFSTLKGQLTNFTKEVLAEGPSQFTGDSSQSSAKEKVEELEALCASQELEISRLKDQNESFRNQLKEFKVPLPDQGDQNGSSSDSWWSVQHWKLPKTSADESTSRTAAAAAVFSEDQGRDDLFCSQQLLEKEKKRCEMLEQQVDKLSLEVLEAMTYKEKWQVAENKVKELVDELQVVQHQFLEQISSSQANAIELREEVENALQQLLHEANSDKLELLHSRQDMVNHIIQMTKKSREAELEIKKLQEDGKQLTEDAINITKKLGDPEEQEIIDGALKALELENQVLKLRNAQLEESCKGQFTPLTQGSTDNFENIASEESFELISRTNADHLQLQSEWNEEKLLMENNIMDLYDKLEKYEAKIVLLEKEKVVLDIELQTLKPVVQDLEIQLASSKDENAVLTTSLEELDQQHQVAIDQLLAVKKCLQNDNDQLAEELRLIKQNRQVEAITAEIQTDDVILESLIYDRVSKLLTFEIPDEVLGKRNDNEKGSQLIGALVKMSAECKWQRDTLEGKVARLMKELRECCEERDSLAELMHTSGLPPIPENSEEVEDLGNKIFALEERVVVLTESRSNLEADCEKLQEEILKLTSKLQVTEDLLRNERNVNKESTAKLNAQISDLLIENNNLHECVKNATDEMRAKQSLLNEAEEKLKYELHVNAEVKLLLHQCEIQKLALQQKLDQLHAKFGVDSLGDINNLKEDYLLLQKKYTEDLQVLQKHIKELELGKSEHERVAKDLEEQVFNMQQQTEETMILNSDLKRELDDKECEIKRLNLSIADYDRKLEERSSVVEDIQVLQKDFNETLLCKDRTERELTDLLERSVKQSESIDYFKCTLADKTQQCNDLINAVGELEKNCAQIKQECVEYQNRAESAELQLEEMVKVKVSLEEDYGRLLEVEKRVLEQETLQSEVMSLSEELRSLKQQMQEARQYSSQLELRVQESKEQVREQEKEISNLMDTIRIANDRLETEKQRRLQLEGECSTYRHTLDQMENEAAKWWQFYRDAITEFNSIQTDKRSKFDLRLHAGTVQKDVPGFNQNIFKGQETAGTDSNIIAEKYDMGKEVITDLTVTSEAIGKDDFENFSKNINVNEATNHLKNMLLEFLSLKKNLEVLLETKVHEIDSLKAMFLKSEQDATVSWDSQFQNSEISCIAKETIARLSEIIKEKDLELTAQLQKFESLMASLHSATVEATSKSEDLARLQSEREELIKVVKQKHEENVHYHAEIQRLSTLLNQELRRSEESRLQQKGLELQFEDKQKTLLNTQNELISVKQRLEKLETFAQNGESFQSVAAVQKTVCELEGDLAKKEEIINHNIEMLTSCEKVIQAKEQELFNLKSEVTRLQAYIEKSSLIAQNTAESAKVCDLQTKVTSLSDALQEERVIKKHLELEAQDLREKESALRKELERLRLHLVGVEESYTQEALKLEAQMQDLKQQLLLAEERIKNSSTAYTSVSIRANQQVETLQEQVRLILQQRDDIQQKLSSTEDQMERQAAALCNLQAVLKQFQRDKEREIVFETDRLRQQLQISHEKEAELATEIKSLKGQLFEAKDGLSAAARLGEQLDRKTDLVASLKEEVSQLKQQLSEMETHVQTASQSSEGKVDRSLVKNIILGYFLAPANSRVDVLRVVATVLDFSDEERTRVGLPQGLGKGASEKQHSASLSEAFIKFLENESRPQPQLRLLPERKISQSSEPGKVDQTPSRRTPLLLHDVQLPSFNQFPIGRNSSSILKDVLKDS